MDGLYVCPVGASKDQRLTPPPAQFEALSRALLEQPIQLPSLLARERRDASDGEHLQPTGRRWPDLEVGPWMLLFFWQVVRGRPECVGMAITSSDPAALEPLAPGELPDRPMPLTTSVLRSLRLSEILSEERMKLERVAVTPQPDGPLSEGFDVALDAVVVAGAPPEQIQMSGSANRSDLTPEELDEKRAQLARMRPATRKRLETAARMYRAAWRLNRNPTQAVVDGMNISPSAAANLISRARAVNLLPPTSSGVPQA